MQNINIPGINVGRLTLKQYKDIRKRHSLWSAQYIRDKLLGKLGHYNDNAVDLRIGKGYNQT